MTKIVAPYTPHKFQQHVHDNLTRFTTMVCHRRFGKTIFALNHILREGLRCKKDRPQYAFISPAKSQTRRNVWDEVKKYYSFMRGVSYHEADLRVEIPITKDNKILVYLDGADNPHAFKGMYLDGIVLDEVSQMPKSIWGDTLSATLADREGWALFIGTPAGNNLLKELYYRGLDPDLQEWSSFMFKVSETKILTDKELASQLRNIGDDMYQQNYECSFDAAVAGTYYGKLLTQLRKEGRIGYIEYNKSLPVITAWDIGMNDKTCIWFAQQVDHEIHLIDYYENSNQILSHYINHIKTKPYKYDYHILPHDVRQRNFSTGSTRLDEIKAAGFRCKIAPKLMIADGIQSVRSILPVCRFNDIKCYEGINALSLYHSEYNDKRGVQLLTPAHDWASHASDAFRYLAVAMRRLSKEKGNEDLVARDLGILRPSDKYASDYDEFDTKESLTL